MNDSGAAVSVCPPDYATEFPLIPVDSSSQCSKSASGQPLNIYGKRTVTYYLGKTTDEKMTITYTVTDVRYPIVATRDLTEIGLFTLFTKD